MTKNRPHRISAAALVVGLGLLAVFSNGTAFAKEKKNIKDEAAWIVPSHIQLAPIMVPVEGRRSAPVTMYLEARNKKFVGNICNYVPRLRDAIFKELSRHPVRVSRKKLVLKGVPRRLLAPMNRAIGNQDIGRNQIKQIFVVAGATKMGGGSISRLPFAQINGCHSVRRAEAARVKAAAAKNEK